jgi:hypothetical protein
VVIGISAALLLLLYAGAFNRRSGLISVTVFIIAAAAAVFIANGRVSGGNIFADSENNPYIFYVILVLAVLAVFLLTRFRAGIALLFVGGSVMMGALQFLYNKNHLAELFVFLCACGALYIYKNYRKNVFVSDTRKTAFGRTFIISAVTAALVIGVGLGAFFGVVRPLDPQPRELKLITKYMALPVVEKAGIADVEVIKDKNMTTQQLNDAVKKAKERAEEREKESGIKDDDKKGDENKNPLFAIGDAFFYAVNYLKQDYRWVIPIALALLAILVAVRLKLYRRRRWLKRLAGRPPEVRVKEMYLYYLAKLKKLKIKKLPSDTLYEFADKSHTALDRFAVSGVGFGALTDTFVKANYGGGSPSEDELDRYLLFHRGFYVNCRRFLGNFKYICLFFVL